MNNQFNPNIIPPIRNFTEFYIRVYTGVLYNAALYQRRWDDLVQTAELRYIPGKVKITPHDGNEMVDPWLEVMLNGMDFNVSDGADHLPMISWEHGMITSVDGPVIIYNYLHQL